MAVTWTGLFSLWEKRKRVLAARSPSRTKASPTPFYSLLGSGEEVLRGGEKEGGVPPPRKTRPYLITQREEKRERKARDREKACGERERFSLEDRPQTHQLTLRDALPANTTHASERQARPKRKGSYTPHEIIVWTQIHYS